VRGFDAAIAPEIRNISFIHTPDQLSSFYHEHEGIVNISAPPVQQPPQSLTTVTSLTPTSVSTPLVPQNPILPFSFGQLDTITQLSSQQSSLQPIPSTIIPATILDTIPIPTECTLLQPIDISISDLDPSLLDLNKQLHNTVVIGYCSHDDQLTTKNVVEQSK
jgi:hypothetical protein